MYRSRSEQSDVATVVTISSHKSENKVVLNRKTVDGSIQVGDESVPEVKGLN